MKLQGITHFDNDGCGEPAHNKNMSINELGNAMWENGYKQGVMNTKKVVLEFIGSEPWYELMGKPEELKKVIESLIT